MTRAESQSTTASAPRGSACTAERIALYSDSLLVQCLPHSTWGFCPSRNHAKPATPFGSAPLPSTKMRIACCCFICAASQVWNGNNHAAELEKKSHPDRRREQVSAESVRDCRHSRPIRVASYQRRTQRDTNPHPGP